MENIEPENVHMMRHSCSMENTVKHCWSTYNCAMTKFTYIPSLSLLLIFIFVFQDRVSLCSPDCPGTHSVDQEGLELTEIHLDLPLCHPH
ncbi:rCG41244, isoform CRA_a [Rattus norvegicus]|uniref:RCG41244, isoform CRA_a n=1 Tax=Rattus norvegicus TaxID=10116 RepID=A6KNG2_RAT|nr:rCG41244, isoform CRA_a [Rattus norvegicus]EDL86687.1 rCG41244, isoform CRA_a [Rattus norvegicus]